ncbi:MAG: A/G-specific adenine glycosylase [Bacteroidetes bacterium]|nr:A/G-specific adenine glycosylase [Bacteroidota bacterium]MCW5894813.1 A/G-specific adenine glycosylase [Bacteroidota bacterium]
MRKTNKQHNIVKSLLAWYTRHGRTFPWRGISDPYRILVSEIMLQQTQASRVLDKYPEFLNRFPSLRSLATATQRDVVIAWKGMGYNNRAVRLHRLTRIVLSEYKGRIPEDYDSLIALPGIGRYTANAILSSAFGQRCAIVDVNVQRVLSRIFWKMDSLRKMRAATEIWQLAEKLLPRNDVYNWNQALMDFGATVCTSRKPDCIKCPVGQACASKKLMTGTTVFKRKPGKQIDGIPNRLHRGKVIQHLRNLNSGRSIRADALGRKILHNFSQRNKKRFADLLLGLEKDGLIRLRGKGILTTRRVTLA